MTELMHKEFIIEDYREAQGLMERDSHFLTLAGEAFGCTVSGRGNLVRVTGDEQIFAERVRRFGIIVSHRSAPLFLFYLK